MEEIEELTDRTPYKKPVIHRYRPLPETAKVSTSADNTTCAADCTALICQFDQLPSECSTLTNTTACP